MSWFILIVSIAVLVSSCSSSEDILPETTDNSSTTDTTAPVIAEVTAVTTPTNDTTPDYTFSSSEAGTITYGGSCSSSTTSATTSNNTITLVSLSEGTYSNCTIIVTDSAGNASSSLTMNSFVVDTTAPSVSFFTLSDTALITGDTATVTLVFSEAVASFSSSADITVANGTLAVMTSTDNITWAGTFTPTANTEDASNVLSLATSYTDTAGNAGPAEDTSNYAVDTLAPTLTFTFDNSTHSNISLNNATGVGRRDGGTITITFSEAVRLLNNDDLTNSNIDSLITLKEINASGTNIAFGATINVGNTIITIDPTPRLESEENVYVAIDATVEDFADNALTATTATFTTCKSCD